MKEKLLVLLSEIERANHRQERLYEKLQQSWERHQKTGEYGYLVETAFYLNQLYSGYERIFYEVAGVFENTLDALHWHKSLSQ
ncbi:hypothetical protein [Desulfovirgula thermocuniculi]|uniref:hypothetical protein n=1 Tax=Desulfovirgula thermocuniculi TaxID=348842 RepID=UPI00040AB9E3|nr:hypothetical protein [Desulfovirgula thermocuniculi]